MTDIEIKRGSLLQPKKLPFDTGYAIVLDEDTCMDTPLFIIITDFGNYIALTKEQILENYEVYGFKSDIKHRIRMQIGRLRTVLAEDK